MIDIFHKKPSIVDLLKKDTKTGSASTIDQVVIEIQRRAGVTSEQIDMGEGIFQVDILKRNWRGQEVGATRVHVSDAGTSRTLSIWELNQKGHTVQDQPTMTVFQYETKNGHRTDLEKEKQGRTSATPEEVARKIDQTLQRTKRGNFRSVVSHKK